MDKMFWFGWFFHGDLQLSLFDRLMFFGELIALVVGAYCVAVPIFWLQEKLKGGKRGA